MIGGRGLILHGLGVVECAFGESERERKGIMSRGLTQRKERGVNTTT